MDSAIAPKTAPEPGRVPTLVHNSQKALTAGVRVRVVRGPLSGLTGMLVKQDVSTRWLLQADYSDGVFVRATADAMEPL